MKAVILAAGVGSRLRPLTDNMPKCLVEVNGISILERQIEALARPEIEEIVIVCGYKAEKVFRFVHGKGYRNIRLVENLEYLNTNNMYSLYLAKDFVPDDFILANADVIFHPGIIGELINNSPDSVIVAEKGSYLAESMKIIVINKKITAISKSIKQSDAYGNSIDVYKFSKAARNVLFEEIGNYIEVQKNRNSWTEVALNQILPQIDFYPLDIADTYYWVEIDDYKDLENANSILNNEPQAF
jgi:choline kinase